jgi:hypothetical protein
VQESPFDKPDPSSTVTTLAPERVALPERTVPPAQPDLSRVDLLLASFVVLLAFLVASTPARNSDFWLHLATGRAVADGSYRFQGDPFGQDATTWIAHSWLYDLLTFALFSSVGGTVLVLLKAGLVALLAELLLRLGKRERGLVWPALAVTLSVLAMSGRLLLQPALLSAVLLALTLWLLERGRRLRADNNAGWLLAYGPICLLFALWANLDDWFLLGPLTVGLYLIGAVGAGGKTRGDLSGLALTLGVGLLACLLTPFHVHGFTVPVELGLSATAQALEKDPALQHLFISPFEETYFHSGAGWSIPGLAYLILAALSGLSFAGSREAWRDWRLPVWLGLFGLSAWSARAVPFFAVAAGPILALNAQDFARRFRPAWLRRDEFFYARLGRASALVLLLALLVSAWPGWLQGTPYEMRRWVVVADPSVRQAAEKLAAWRRDGQLTEADRVFNFSPEEANYFAWFCPAEKGIVDARLRVSPAVAADYVTVRRALLDESPPRTDWRSLLRAWHVNHIVVYDSNSERVNRVFRRLVQNKDEWILIGLTGRTSIFGWKDPQRPAVALNVPRLPVKEDAYHPSEAKKAPAEGGPGPQSPAWWSAFVTARPDGSPERDEAALFLLDFETRSLQNRDDRSLAWDASRIASVAGSAVLPSLGVGMQQSLDLFCFKIDRSETPIRLNSREPTLERVAFGLRMSYLLQQDDAPAEYLWLAIRAARNAVHKNPHDAHAYLILGESYLRLMHNTRERAWKESMPILSRLRQVQASTALNQALLLQPDLMTAHDSLSLLYQDMGLWDLRLKHRREVLRLTKERGQNGSESLKEWDDRVAKLQEEVQQLDGELTRTRELLDVNSANLKIMDRVRDAAKYGQGGRALEILLASDAASFGPDGVGMELHLLLTTGRVREVREWMTPDHRETLGDDTYLLDRLELASACGDYDKADAELAELMAVYNRSENIFGVDLTLHQAISLGIANEVLQGRVQNETFVNLRLLPERELMFFNSIKGYIGRLQRIANFTVLRGLLAFERGDTEVARAFMARALETYQSGAGLDFGGRSIAQHYVNALSAPVR